MKKICPLIVVLLLVTLPVSAQEAMPKEPRNHPISKFFRGVINVVTSPIEIPRQIQKNVIQGQRESSFPAPWILSGTIEGVIEFTKRFGSGAWDVVSFPFSAPPGYAPLKKPDYVFMNWPQEDNVPKRVKIEVTE